MMMKFLLVAACIALQACSNSSRPIVKDGGNPRSSVEWKEPLAANCSNVSMAKRIYYPELKFHHSTDSSVFPEIIQSIAIVETEPRDEDNSAARLKKEYSRTIILQSFGLDGQERAFDTFCMTYNAPAESVTKIVRETLPVFGNKVLTDQEQFGNFYTEVMERQHSTAKWRDGFYINITKVDEYSSEVRIYRSLERLRVGGWVRSKSDGYNEAWILQWIRTSLPQ